MSNKPSYEDLEKRVRELERVEWERRKTEEELAQIFSMSLDMICIADIDTATFIKVNPAFTEVLGYAEEELLEKPFFDFIHPDDIDATRSVVEQKLQTGAKVINFENRYRCKDGSFRWLSWVSHPNPKKRIAIAIARDITEWKRNEEALKKSKALLDATGRMARVGGWELDAETLEVTWTAETYRIHEVPPDRKPSLQKAIDFFHPEDRERLAQAVQRALDHAEPYDLEVRFITARGKHLWTRTICRPEIDREIQPDCGLIMADPTQIHQVAMNIVTNAYHAVEANGGTITVRLKEAELDGSDLPGTHLKPGRYAVLSVSDTGHGMPAELIEKIFDPYFTTKEQGKGTGLGLAVVYGIVQGHKGNIKVYSEIGKGTTFNVYLPMMEKPPDTPTADGAEVLRTGTERILLVDDEPSIAKLEKQSLERLGYQVTMRVNSLEALEAFRTKPDSFDLIMTDMTMPNMTGDQLAGEIKSIRSDIPIIICTGFSERINDENAGDLGISGVLMKPAIKSEMAKMVRKVLAEASGQKKREFD